MNLTPYYDKNGIVIYVGDCLEVMPQLDGPFAAIIADWPYGTTACSWDSVIPLEPLWKECKRLSDTAVLFGGEPFTSALIMSNIEQFKYNWYLRKNKTTGFLNAKKQPLRKYETVSVFYSTQPTYNPQFTIGKLHGTTGAKNLDITPVYGKQKTLKKNNRTDIYYPNDELEYITIKKPIHPTQKPEPLMAYLVRTYTSPGDIILDNTMGSGTTLVAAQNEGRRAVGIEMSEKYCKIAVERLRQPSFWSLPAKSEPQDTQGELI